MALWREALLARAVLQGKTRGYRHHPQLERFRAHAAPRAAICAYLGAVHEESLARGYAFDRAKAGPRRSVAPMSVTCGQLDHEWQHLLRKLSFRSPAHYRRLRTVRRPDCHPLLRPCAGGPEPWERFLPRGEGWQ